MEGIFVCDDGLCMRTNRKTLTHAYCILLYTLDKTNGTLSLGVTVNFCDSQYFFHKNYANYPTIEMLKYNIIMNAYNKVILQVSGVMFLHTHIPLHNFWSKHFTSNVLAVGAIAAKVIAVGPEF